MIERRQDPFDPMADDSDIVIDEPLAEPEVTADGVVTELEDGSIEITPAAAATAPVEAHDSNLAEFIDPDVRTRIGSDLLALIEEDIRSREEWEKTITDRLDLIGVRQEKRNDPWPGACDLQHTMVAEAAVRFQSNAIMEIFPAEGPVKSSILGEITKEKQDQAEREKGYLNYLLTEEIEDYRSETEKYLFGLALFGSAFRKVYEDPLLERPTASYVPAQDFIISEGTTSLASSQRYTHRMRLPNNTIRELQVSGWYLDVEIDDSVSLGDGLTEEIDKLKQQEATVIDTELSILYESHCLWNVPGYEDENGIALPYIVTIDKSGKLLAVYRNWAEADPKRKKLQWFAGCDFIPGVGSYGFGLLHLIGGSAKAATSIQRQLIDAGTLANLPGGFKAKGPRVKGDDNPHRPGEWRDYDVGIGKLADCFFPLPYKEPSAILFQLLGSIVEDGRRLGSIADAEIGDVNSQAPVGTTLAVMEKAMKVMSAIQARCHAAMRREFKILVRVIKGSLIEDYPYDVAGESRKLLKTDFDGRIDVIPVSDPNAATMSQRLVLYQMAVQLSQSAPQIFDLPVLYRQMLRVAGIKDVDMIIPDKSNIKPMDPVTTIMAITTGKPVKAYEWQDHPAYIAVIDNWTQDPLTAAALGQNPQAQAIFAAAQAAKAEHFAYKYRADIERELGVPLPGLDQELPGDIMSHLAVAVEKASARLLAKNKAQVAQKEAEAKAQDPVFQLEMAELEVKKGELQRKTQLDQGRLQLDAAKMQTSDATERERIAAQERMAGEAAIDRNQQFLAEAKMDAPKRSAEVQKIKAQIVELLAKVEQLDKEPSYAGE